MRTAGRFSAGAAMLRAGGRGRGSRGAGEQGDRGVGEQRSGARGTGEQGGWGAGRGGLGGWAVALPRGLPSRLPGSTRHLCADLTLQGCGVILTPSAGPGAPHSWYPPSTSPKATAPPGLCTMEILRRQFAEGDWAFHPHPLSVPLPASSSVRGGRPLGWAPVF